MKFLIAFSLFLTWTVCEACQCSGEPGLKWAYCHYDFVIKATPESVVRDRQFVDKYTLKDVTVLKGSDKAKAALGENDIFSYSQDGICGVELELNKEYLLQGNVTDKEPWIHSCGYNSPFANFSEEQRNAVEKGYDC